MITRYFLASFPIIGSSCLLTTNNKTTTEQGCLNNPYLSCNTEDTCRKIDLRAPEEQVYFVDEEIPFVIDIASNYSIISEQSVRLESDILGSIDTEFNSNDCTFSTQRHLPTGTHRTLSAYHARYLLYWTSYV